MAETVALAMTMAVAGGMDVAMVVSIATPEFIAAAADTVT
jgi:hypothetical protein